VIRQTNGPLAYFTSEAISVPHCFTTRLGGVSRGTLASLNIGAHRGDDPGNVARNYALLGQALGFDPACLVLTRQTHSDSIRPVTAPDSGKGFDHSLYPECDGLITCTPGVGLVVFTADCTPVLLHDPVTGAVGAVHAGWRGTAAGIVKKAVEAMAACYGCRPQNIRAAIGPNIAGCCFATDADVPQALTAALPEAAGYIRRQGEKFYPDLKQINALWLRQAGVNAIDISDACTCCDATHFWSHRRDGAGRGSQGAIIICKEAQP